MKKIMKDRSKNKLSQATDVEGPSELNSDYSSKKEKEKEKEKENPKSKIKSKKEPAPKLTPDIVDSEREAVMQSIIEAYIKRTGNRVILLETLDLALILFPVEDMKKNLREMGFWGE